MKYVGVFLGTLVLMLGLTWIFTGNDFFLYKFFAPKQEAVRRQVFENSRAFNQGMIQELENMQLEYIKANKDGKQAMRSIILHRASGYNLDDPAVPQSLRAFISQLKNETGELN